MTQALTIPFGQSCIRFGLMGGVLGLLLGGSWVRAQDVQQLCVDLINQKRATLGLPALARWRDGEALATSEVHSDAKEGVPHAAYRRSTRRETSAQNECQNSDARPAPMINVCINDMWNEGPETGDGQNHGHYLNMTSPLYAKVACGFATAPNGTLWSAQNFIAESDSHLAPQSPAKNPMPTNAPVKSPVNTPSNNSAPIDAMNFNQSCVAQINSYRSKIYLPPYKQWTEGATCASHLVAMIAKGLEPNDADEACLNAVSDWDEGVCTLGPNPTVDQALNDCLGDAWKAGPGTGKPHDGYNAMASTAYVQAACAIARKPGGSTVLMKVFATSGTNGNTR